MPCGRIPSILWIEVFSVIFCGRRPRLLSRFWQSSRTNWLEHEASNCGDLVKPSQGQPMPCFSRQTEAGPPCGKDIWWELPCLGRHQRLLYQSDGIGYRKQWCRSIMDPTVPGSRDVAWGSQIWGILCQVKREQHKQGKIKPRRRGFGCIFVKLCNFSFKSKFGRFLVKFWLKVVIFSVIFDVRDGV